MEHGPQSRYKTKGVGSLIDATFRNANVVLGTRYDWVDIHSHIPSYVLTTPDLDAKGKDNGLSWSGSASYEVVKGVRPYVTYSQQETLVFGLDGGIGIPVVPNAMNTAELREAGIKSSLLDNKMFRRRRLSPDTNLVHRRYPQVLSTLSTGWEAEMRWAVNSRLSMNAGGTWQSTKYTPLRPATISVNPTFFGVAGQLLRRPRPDDAARRAAVCASAPAIRTWC